MIILSGFIGGSTVPFHIIDGLYLERKAMMDTPLARVLHLLRREMSALEKGSETYLLLQSALADLCVGVARAPTLQLLTERSVHWFGLAMNAPSDVLRDFEAGLEPTNHSGLFQQMAEDFEDVLQQLQPSGQLQEASAS